MTMPPEIIERHVELLKININSDQFNNCWQISADYTRYYVISNDENAIFFGEICQNVFTEMQTLFRRYTFPEEKRKEIRQQWTSKLDSVVRAMKSGTDEQKYVAMRELRVYMTKLQFDTWYMQAPPERHSISLPP
jgi:hypothetical protein